MIYRIMVGHAPLRSPALGHPLQYHAARQRHTSGAADFLPIFGLL
jgi:hypothetical protein